MEQDTSRIVISSADGWSDIEFRPFSAKDGTCFEIVARGRFWDRRQDLQIESDQLVDDFNVSFLQARLSKEKLTAFSGLLEAWLIKPEEIRAELTSNGYPTVSIFIGEIESLICSSTKPAFVFGYKASRIETNIQFIVDQSCLNLLLQDLKRFLSKQNTI